MKKNSLFLIFTIFLSIVVLSSCNDDDDYLIDSYLDCNLQMRTDNRGYFENTPANYTLYDLANINYVSDIQEIRLIDTWIDIYGNFYSGDIIEKLEIYVEGVGTYTFPADYIIVNPSGIRIDDKNAPGYFRFMSDVMRELEYRGRIRIVASGYHNNSFKNIDIVLKNTLDVRTW